MHAKDTTKVTKMTTKKEIENEIEVRMERIKLIWTFGDKSEFDYERGYIDCLRWILENFKELKVNHDPIFWRRTFGCSNGVDFDEGCKEATRWALEL